MLLLLWGCSPREKQSFSEDEWEKAVSQTQEKYFYAPHKHMNIPEAVKGFKELGAKYFIPTQWGAFHLGSEPAGFPGLELERFIQTQDLEPSLFKIMDIGEILKISS